MHNHFQIIDFLKFIVTPNRRNASYHPGNASYRPGNTNYLNEDLQASIQDLPFWFKINKNTYSRILWVYANTYVCIHFYMSVFLSESGTFVFKKCKYLVGVYQQKFQSWNKPLHECRSWPKITWIYSEWFFSENSWK